MIARHRYHRFRPSRGSAGPPPPASVLPAFCRPMGLDFIVTEAGEVVLVELQHGFGRRGLLRLFPLANRIYRKTHWSLRRQRGQHPWLAERLRAICSDKIKTYRLFSDLQPASLAYGRWSVAVERWLDGLSSELILVKPPRGSCGEGIEVFDRSAFRRARGALLPPGLVLPVLLQAFVQSRLLLDGAGRPHVGCIRHIVLLHSDGARLSFIHLPSYWRVSPAALGPAALGPAACASCASGADREALTANISRGATPLPVEATDGARVREAAETICARLLVHALALERIERGASHVISPEGELPGFVVEGTEPC